LIEGAYGRVAAHGGQCPHVLGGKRGVYKMTTKFLKPGRCRQNRRGLYQLFLPIAYLALASCVAQAADALKFVHTAEFGEVSFYGPKDSPQGFVLLFSGEEGINEQDHIAITRLVDNGMLVAAINARPTLKILGQDNAHQGCIELSLPRSFGLYANFLLKVLAATMIGERTD